MVCWLLAIDGAVDGKSKFRPEMVLPKVFRPEQDLEWRKHLNQYGYVVVGAVLPEEDVETADDPLEKYLKQIRPTESSAPSLQTICDTQLPAHQNSGLRHRGPPLGEFA